ncbi:MAG: hypothetical protein SNJ74_10560 [Fimbriimonadaceae bacterium]
MSKRLFGVVLWLAAATLGHSQVQLAVHQGANRVGTARFSQKLLPEGGKLVQISMELEVGERKARIRQETRYNARGEAVRVFQETVGDQPGTTRRIIADLSAEAADVVVEQGGNRTTRRVPLAPGAPRENQSEFWFVRDRPKPGDTAEFYSFELSTLEWRIRRIRYVRATQARLGDRPVPAHELSVEEGRVLLDEGGLPIRLEMGGLTLVRIP